MASHILPFAASVSSLQGVRVDWEGHEQQTVSPAVPEQKHSSKLLIIKFECSVPKLSPNTNFEIRSVENKSLFVGRKGQVSACVLCVCAYM